MNGQKITRALRVRFGALAAFVAALWAIQILNWATGYGLNAAFGLIPRHAAGLDGIIAMPVLHGGFAHLISNTPPLVITGALLMATASRSLFAVNAVIVVLGGSLVWLFGGSAIHMGSSGLVFGWLGFLIARGLVDRSIVTLGVSLLVGFLYRSLIWGVLPGQPGVSWEAHAFGALAGVIAAVALRTSRPEG